MGIVYIKKAKSQTHNMQTISSHPHSIFYSEEPW